MSARTGCEQLAKVCEARSSERPDALTSFSEIHLCICQSISNRVALDTQLGRFNDEFVRVFLSVYDAYQVGDLDSLSEAWINALRLYELEPGKYFETIARMAQAHVYTDLARLLRRFAVSEEDYMSVTNDINECLGRQAWGFENSEMVTMLWKNGYRLANPFIKWSIKRVRKQVYAKARADRRLFRQNPGR